MPLPSEFKFDAAVGQDTLEWTDCSKTLSINNIIEQMINIIVRKVINLKMSHQCLRLSEVSSIFLHWR